jgi:Ca2+-binding EF-hand superfamily protein
MGKQLLTSGVIMFTCAMGGAVALASAPGESLAFSAAGSQGRRTPARTRFEVMDQNGDGEISRQEWRGSARSFDVHDWNGDGRLSGDEVRVGGRQQDDFEQADHTPSRAERFMSWTERGFANLDHDRNRRISSDEWHYDRETFLRADRNRDGTLDVNEFLGGDMDDDRGDQFDDLDVNRNGRVERREWHASDDAFVWLDRNRDGVLTRTEVVGDNAGGGSADQFASLDMNRDGRLARGEWHWSAGSFAARDLNRDGWLTRSEFAATAGEGAQSAGSEVTVTVDARQRWTDARLDVRAGDVLTFASRGSIQMSNDGNDVASPGGARSGRGAPQAPVNAVAGALIARIGNGAPFLVGDRTSVNAPGSGRLQLGVNDDHLEDNRGNYQVTVGVQRRTSLR